VTFAPKIKTTTIIATEKAKPHLVSSLRAKQFQGSREVAEKSQLLAREIYFNIYDIFTIVLNLIFSYMYV